MTQTVTSQRCASTSVACPGFLTPCCCGPTTTARRSSTAYSSWRRSSWVHTFKCPGATLPATWTHTHTHTHTHTQTTPTVQYFLPLNIGILQHGSVCARVCVCVIRKPHDPVEDASATVRLAHLCVSRGMGLVRWEPVPPSITTTVFTTAQPPTPEAVMLAFNLNACEVECMYLRGSRAIGTHRVDSDWDFFVVLSGHHNAGLEDVLLKCGNVDVALYGVPVFRRLLAVHTVYIIDGVAQRPWTYPNRIDFLAELSSLRASTARSVWMRDLAQSVGFESSRKVTHAALVARNIGCP